MTIKYRHHEIIYCRDIFWSEWFGICVVIHIFLNVSVPFLVPYLLLINALMFT